MPARAPRPTPRPVRQHTTRTVGALVAAAALSLSLAACGGDEEASAEEGACSYPADGEAAKPVEAPPADPEVEGETSATLATSVGDLRLTLDAESAPCTVNSFVSLAEQGYYDGTACHRLGNAPGFQLLQCGDPTGTGSGGPGYSFADELTGEETYPAGTIAMANAGPDTNGSQFFLVFGDTQLPPDYTVFGSFDEAAVRTLLEVGDAGVAQPGPDGTGEPATPVEITGVTVG